MQDPNPSGSSGDDWQRCADLDESSSDDEGSWDDWGNEWPATNSSCSNDDWQQGHDWQHGQNDWQHGQGNDWQNDCGTYDQQQPQDQLQDQDWQPGQDAQHDQLQDHDWQPGQNVNDDVVEALLDALSAKHAGNMANSTTGNAADHSGTKKVLGTKRRAG